MGYFELSFIFQVIKFVFISYVLGFRIVEFDFVFLFYWDEDRKCFYYRTFDLGEVVKGGVIVVNYCRDICIFETSTWSFV